MSPQFRKRLTTMGLTAALVAALLCVVGAIIWVERLPRGVADAASPADLATLESIERSFNWIAESVKPAVVFIEAEQPPAEYPEDQRGGGPFLIPPDMGPEQGPPSERPEGQPGPGPFLVPPDMDPGQFPPWFRDWFRDFYGPERPDGGPDAGPDAPSPRFRSPRGRQQRPPMPQVGQGSGVVIDPDGYIVTNNHVVGNAARILVHLPSGDTYVAQVAGTDQISDLAVIKIDPEEPLVAAKLGESAEAKVGSWAMAIGYPFGARGYSGYGPASGRFDEGLRYEPTVTVGVISALERQIDSEIRGRPFRHLIQTDAPINPGSSGGPLLNVRGEVIGINQAIYTNPFGGGNIGVGFAVPIDSRNREIIGSLTRGEVVIRGQLGVEIRPVARSISRIYGADHGVWVDAVSPDSPAERGGIKDEDIVLEYDGQKVTSVDQFVGWVQRTRPDSTVKVKVLRDGKPVTLKVTVAALAMETAEQRPKPVEKHKLGLTVETLPAEAAEEMGLSGGVRVESANPMDDGFRSGLRPGDVIVKINRQEITDADHYSRIVGGLEVGDPVVIRARRGDRYVTAQIERLSE
jgi:serine protease Do